MPVRGKHIGTLIKLHGYKGDMLIKGPSESISNLKEGTALFIEIDGQRVPFFIESFSPDLSGEKGIIKFDFIDSDMQARRYITCHVFEELQAEDDNTAVRIAKDYVGYIVIDTISGQEFPVLDFIDDEANPLLILDKGREEMMLPINADYFKNAKMKGKNLFVEFPEGLLSD